jgi:hypothetical protein
MTYLFSEIAFRSNIIKSINSFDILERLSADTISQNSSNDSGGISVTPHLASANSGLL